MGDRRDRVLDAAIDVLAGGGGKALTHRAVDAHAGLPPGSTSNLFRTRRALVVGVLSRLTAREAAAVPPAAPAELDDSEDGLVALSAAAIAHALGPGRIDTLARRALFHDAASDPSVADALTAASRHWWQFVAGLLTTARVPDAPARARRLLAYVDGVIADQLARPEPGFDPAAAIAPAVHGILRLPG